MQYPEHVSHDIVDGGHTVRRIPRQAAVLLSVIILAVLLIGVGPIAAQASWPVESQACEQNVELGFEATYTSRMGETTVHRGVDLLAEPSSTVRTPVDGVVSFVGNVPTDDMWGGDTRAAVTIKMQDGRRVTLMPLESIGVSVGDAVEEGQPIAMLASAGDMSSSPTHLHIGLLDGDTYQNPMPLLGFDVSSQNDQPDQIVPAVVPLTVDSGAVAAEEIAVNGQENAANEFLLEQEPQACEQVEGSIISSGGVSEIPKAQAAAGPQSEDLLALGMNAIASHWDDVCDLVESLSASMTMIPEGISHAIAWGLLCAPAIATTVIACSCIGKHVVAKKAESRVKEGIATASRTARNHRIDVFYAR